MYIGKQGQFLLIKGENDCFNPYQKQIKFDDFGRDIPVYTTITWETINYLNNIEDISH